MRTKPYRFNKIDCGYDSRDVGFDLNREQTGVHRMELNHIGKEFDDHTWDSCLRKLYVRRMKILAALKDEENKKVKIKQIRSSQGKFSFNSDKHVSVRHELCKDKKNYFYFPRTARGCPEHMVIVKQGPLAFRILFKDEERAHDVVEEIVNYLRCSCTETLVVEDDEEKEEDGED